MTLKNSEISSKKKNQFPASFEKLEDIATLVPCFHLAILRGN